MSFDSALDELLFETVTIAPFSSVSATQVVSYGTAVTYKAQAMPFVQKDVDAQGREFVTRFRVVIPERVAVDPRSKLTLPSGFTPQTLPIRVVRPVKGLGLDHTEILGALVLLLLNVMP